MLLEIEMKTRIRLEFIQHLFGLENEDAYCSLRRKSITSCVNILVVTCICIILLSTQSNKQIDRSLSLYSTRSTCFVQVTRRLIS